MYKRREGARAFFYFFQKMSTGAVVAVVAAAFVVVVAFFFFFFRRRRRFKISREKSTRWLELLYYESRLAGKRRPVPLRAMEMHATRGSERGHGG